MSRRDTISIVIENRDDHRRWTPLTTGAMDTRIRREVERTIEEQDRTGEFTYVGISYNGMTHRLYTVDEIEEGQRHRAAQEQAERDAMQCDRETYAMLRTDGTITLAMTGVGAFNRDSRQRVTSRLRTWARRDGLKVQTATYDRTQTVVRLLDPTTGGIVRPDHQEA